MKKNTGKVVAGDVFAVVLPNGKWAAVKVIQIIERSYLLKLTAYYHHEEPSKYSKELDEIFYEDREDEKGVHNSFFWVDGNPPANYQWICRKEVTREEGNTSSNLYAGLWKIYLPMIMVYHEEWESGVTNVDDLIHKTENGHTIRYSPIPDELFWFYMQMLQGKRNVPIKGKIDLLIKLLSEKSVDEIVGFEEALSRKVFQLDSPRFAFTPNESKKYFSPDAFLYARCWAVAKGESHYNAIISSPQLFDPKRDFEYLLTVAPLAYERKTKEPFDMHTSFNYETFANETEWNKHTD